MSVPICVSLSNNSWTRAMGLEVSCIHIPAAGVRDQGSSSSCCIDLGVKVSRWTHTVYVYICVYSSLTDLHLEQPEMGTGSGHLNLDPQWLLKQCFCSYISVDAIQSWNSQCPFRKSHFTSLGMADILSDDQVSFCVIGGLCMHHAPDVFIAMDIS